VILGNITASTHAESNISKLKAVSISNAFTCHADVTSLLLNTSDQEELVFWGSTSNNLDSSFDCFELVNILEAHTFNTCCLINISLVWSNRLSEFLTSDGSIFKIQVFRSDDSSSSSNIFACVKMVS